MFLRRSLISNEGAGVMIEPEMDPSLQETRAEDHNYFLGANPEEFEEMMKR